jgi:hypothetical protein
MIAAEPSIGSIPESSPQEASLMPVASTTYPSSSSSNTSLFAGSPPDMTNDQLQATWQAVEQQAHALPSGQREHSEDAAFMQLYRSGQISANDLNSLLTKAADQNPQVDPGKEAVARLEAEGLKLTGQQKDAIETSARNRAAQAKVADAERLLNIERSAPGQDSGQALSIGITIFDANGKQEHLLVRNTGPGVNSIQQIHDLGDGYRDQVLIDAAEDQLEAEMAATPADKRKKLSEKVHAPGGTYEVTLDTNGKLSVTKETGFWGSILHGLEAIAPIALAAIPGVGPIAAAAYLGTTGGYDIANGNVAGGLADIAGGIAGVGGFVGGSIGSTIQDAATVTQYGDQAYTAANSGNVWGVINTAVGAMPDTTNLASDFGASSDVLDTAQTVTDEIGTAASVGQSGQAAVDAIEAGNIFRGVSSFNDIANAGGLADITSGMAGVGGFVGGAIGSTIIQDAATVGDQVYAATNSGNVWGVINTATGAMPGITNLASDLGASSDFLDTAQTVADEIATAASFGQSGQAAVNAIEAGTIFRGVSSFAALAPEALGLFGNHGNSLAPSVQPVLTEVVSAAQLGQAVQSTATAVQQGNLIAAGAETVDQVSSY